MKLPERSILILEASSFIRKSEISTFGRFLPLTFYVCRGTSNASVAPPVLNVTLKLPDVLMNPHL
jgi:hypothetical protein